VALVVLIILFPWLGAVVLACLPPILGGQIGRCARLPPAASFLITLTIVPSAIRLPDFLYALSWLPALGVNFSLWLDGLSVFFALLVLGINLLIMCPPPWRSSGSTDDCPRRVPLTGTTA
jgi:NADH:ubiquinone oxidoreductase subunit 5 (subunit L)/multisubunit Na+/H+ antiporter MnhA subunit